MTNPTAKHQEEAGERHTPDCQWERTAVAECAYRATHHYCPHLEHACTCPVWNPTEDQAEAILREHGTSGKEVANAFIEQLLKERSEAIAALSSRDREIREVLEGLGTVLGTIDGAFCCWCPADGLPRTEHTPACLAARVLWEKVTKTD